MPSRFTKNHPRPLLFHDNFTSPFNAISTLKKRLIGNYSLLFTFYAAKRAFYATFVSQPFFCVIIINENASAFLRGVFGPLFIMQQGFSAPLLGKTLLKDLENASSYSGAIYNPYRARI